MQYHAIRIPCPKCNRFLTPMEVCCRSDGGILLEGICVICGVEFHWESTIAKLVLLADCMDKSSRGGSLEDMEVTSKPC